MIEHAANRSAWMWQIRRVKSHISGQIPLQHAPTWYCYDSGEFVRLLDKCLDMADWNGYEKRKTASKRPASCAAARSATTSSLAASSTSAWIFASIRTAPSTVFGGTLARAGHATVFAQLVHEFLGVPFEQIRYARRHRQSAIRARHLRSAQRRGRRQRAPQTADAIIDKAKLMAAAMLEADAGDIEFKDGNFKVAGTDKAVPLVEVAKASFAPMGPMTGFGIGLEGSGSHSPEPPSHRRRACGRGGDRPGDR
jgi:carbon-monoxide dehydrogenase large subunit